MERFGTPADTFRYLTVLFLVNYLKLTSTPSTYAKLFWSLRRNKANLPGPRVWPRRKPIAGFLRQHTFSTPSGTRERLHHVHPDT
jgi:hypothetical protein